MADKKISQFTQATALDPTDLFVIQRGANNFSISGEKLIDFVSLTVQEEGVDVDTGTNLINFIGTGVTASAGASAGEVDVTIPGDKIATQDTNALVQSPTATEDGYFLAWNDTNQEYELVMGATGGGGIYGGNGSLPASSTVQVDMVDSGLDFRSSFSPNHIQAISVTNTTDTSLIRHQWVNNFPAEDTGLEILVWGQTFPANHADYKGKSGLIGLGGNDLILGTRAGTGTQNMYFNIADAGSNTAFSTVNAMFIEGSTRNVSVGTLSPNASALFSIASTSKGFLPPVMTGAQVEAIGTPATGLLAYATSAGGGDVTGAGYYQYDGANWVEVGGGGNTLYSADDSLTGTRTVTMGEFNLNFSHDGVTTAKNQSLVYKTDQTDKQMRFEVTNDSVDNTKLFMKIIGSTYVSGTIDNYYKAKGIVQGGLDHDLLLVSQGTGGVEILTGDTNLATGVTKRAMSISSAQVVTLDNLSGVGSRMVVADASGVLSTQAIPSGGGDGIYGGSGSLSGATTVTQASNNLIFDTTGTINTLYIEGSTGNVGIGGAPTLDFEVIRTGANAQSRIQSGLSTGVARQIISVNSGSTRQPNLQLWATGDSYTGLPTSLRGRSLILSSYNFATVGSQTDLVFATQDRTSGGTTESDVVFGKLNEAVTTFTEWARFDNSAGGLLGINEATPAAQLHVSGASGVNPLQVDTNTVNNALLVESGGRLISERGNGATVDDDTARFRTTGQLNYTGVAPTKVHVNNRDDFEATIEANHASSNASRLLLSAGAGTNIQANFNVDSTGETKLRGGIGNFIIGFNGTAGVNSKILTYAKSGTSDVLVHEVTSNSDASLVNGFRVHSRVEMSDTVSINTNSSASNQLYVVGASGNAPLRVDTNSIDNALTVASNGKVGMNKVPTFYQLEIETSANALLQTISTNTGASALARIEHGLSSNDAAIFIDSFDSGYTSTPEFAAHTLFRARYGGVGVVAENGSEIIFGDYNYGGGGIWTEHAKFDSFGNFIHGGTGNICAFSAGYIRVTERAAPGTPPSGGLFIYAKTDGRLYYKNDAGVEFGPL